MSDENAELQEWLDNLPKDKSPEQIVAELSGVKEKVSLYDDDGRKKSQSTLLVDLCEVLELFHDADGAGYACIRAQSHREVLAIQSRNFKNWMSHEYYKLTGQGARGAAIADAIATIEAKALHKSAERKVYQRVAWLGDRIIIDMVDEEWRVVEISAKGWQVLDKSPVMFTRRAGMAALPTPKAGNLLALEKFVNVNAGDFPLIVGWLLMAARGCGPYPVLILNGEQGTGKSTTTRVLRSCIDPSTVPLRGLTRDVRDLLVTATNSHVIVSDNLSGLSSEMSDVFCRLSTGGGFAERQLYSNRDEVLVNIQRPIILNGIEEVASRGDLMERSLMIHLPLIGESRETESTFWQRFDEALPGIFGGLCSALANALAHLNHTQLERKPRMADFALWVCASEHELGWERGTFMRAYSANQDAGVEVALEASPFGEALLKHVTGTRRIWEGTATDLLNELEHKAHERSIRSPAWPKSGKGAASALRRLSPLFRRMGITIDMDHREAGTGRRIVAIDSSGFLSSQPSHRHKSINGAASSRDDWQNRSSQTVTDRHTTVTPGNPVTARLPEVLAGGRDDCDAKSDEIFIPAEAEV